MVTGNIPVNLSVSADRREVTCSAGGECGVCGARGGDIILKAEGMESRLTFCVAIKSFP